MRLRAPVPLLAIALACSPEAPMEDPTPPGVSARIPEPASGNVWVRDPIRATFSEPLDSLTVTPANVSVTRNGGNELGKTLQLSDDGRVLGIVLVSPPTVPATITVTLAAAIADRAGNPLTPGAPWSWTLPAWQQPGGAPLSAPSGSPWQVVAVEPGGAILVASSEPVEVNGAAVGTVRVKRWTGAAWEPLGGALNVVATKNAIVPSLAVAADGTPFVAWMEETGGALVTQVFVKRWDGGSGTWQLLGVGLNVNTGKNASWPRIRVGPDGHPVVAWQEHAVGRTVADLERIYAVRWNGAAWVALAPAAGEPSLNVDPERWAWGAVLALEADGTPVVSWLESAGAGYIASVYVKRWSGSSWQQPGPGGPLNASAVAAGAPQIEVDGSGNPTVAWDEGSPARVHVRSLVAGAWITRGGGAANLVLSEDAQGVALALDGGAPTVAFREANATSGVWQVVVRREQTGAWATVGPAVNVDLTHQADAPILALDDRGTPVVSFRERNATGGAAPFELFLRRYNQ